MEEEQLHTMEESDSDDDILGMLGPNTDPIPASAGGCAPAALPFNRAVVDLENATLEEAGEIARQHSIIKRQQHREYELDSLNTFLTKAFDGDHMNPKGDVKTVRASAYSMMVKARKEALLVLPKSASTAAATVTLTSATIATQAITTGLKGKRKTSTTATRTTGPTETAAPTTRTTPESPVARRTAQKKTSNIGNKLNVTVQQSAVTTQQKATRSASVPPQTDVQACRDTSGGDIQLRVVRISPALTSAPQQLSPGQSEPRQSGPSRQSARKQSAVRPSTVRAAADALATGDTVGTSAGGSRRMRRKVKKRYGDSDSDTNTSETDK